MTDEHEYVNVPTYGAHAYRIEGDVGLTKPFPPEGAKFVAVLSGRFSKENEPSDDWLKMVKEQGATHLALGQGDTFLVRKL